MIFDFHIHTQKCKSGDSEKRIISPVNFITKMNQNNVGLCAITNHNKFDLNEYNFIKQSQNRKFSIWPGIEVDVEFKNHKKKHVILICDPNLKDDFHDTFGATNLSYDDHYLISDDLIQKIKNYKTNQIFIIAHYLSKASSLTEEEENDLRESLNGYLLLLEPTNLRSMGILNQHRKSAIVGSDVKDWSEYSAKNLPNMKFYINDFNKFLSVANRSEPMVTSYLDETSSIKIDVEHFSAKLYQDITILFGPKGSGKTYLIDNYLIKSLKEDGKKFILHRASEYQKSFNDMLENIRKTHLNPNIDISTIKIEFEKVTAYNEEFPKDRIALYINYKQSQNGNKKKDLLRKTNSTFPFSAVNRPNIISGYSKYIKNVGTTKELVPDSRWKLEEVEKESIFKNLDLLKNKIKAAGYTELQKDFTSNKIYCFIDNLKKIVEKKTGNASKPTSLGFYELVRNRSQFLSSLSTLRICLAKVDHIEKAFIGSLDEIGFIYVQVETKLINSKSSLEDGFAHGTLMKNRTIIKKINEFDKSNFKEINKYFEFDTLEKQGFLDDAICSQCSIVDKDGIKFNPSEGQKAILSITGILGDLSYDYYIFDEIERGLGHKYVAEVLIPMLDNLRRQGKTIIISTHNANIAISTLPHTHIFCNYSKTSPEHYYYGNMYSNILHAVNSGSVAVKSWELEAVTHLEGSDLMLNRRLNIYGIR